MRNIFIILLVSLLAIGSAIGQDEFYFGGKGELDPSIPTPESFFGFQIGQSLVRYDKVIEYFRLLAEVSDRASLEVLGKTYQHREQVVLTITSPENQGNLENIREEHLRWVDPHASADLEDQKVIVQLGCDGDGGGMVGSDAVVGERE